MLVPRDAANWSYGDPPGSTVQAPSAWPQLAHCCQPAGSTPMPFASPWGYVTSVVGTRMPALQREHVSGGHHKAQSLDGGWSMGSGR